MRCCINVLKCCIEKLGNFISYSSKNVTVYNPLYLSIKNPIFIISVIGPEILTKEEWKIKIKEFLYEQLGEEKGLTACLIIHSCNKNKEKVNIIILNNHNTLSGFYIRESCMYKLCRCVYVLFSKTSNQYLLISRNK